ncbi:GCN5-related N-acetyltransferase [Colletotrichum tofieldiae]|nr:GCN5-related N-acetyltransferase [Colletotrichum tofieldiae]
MAASQDLPAPILTLKKGVIRPYHSADAASLAQAANSKAVAAFLRNYFPHPYTLADAESWISLNQTPPFTTGSSPARPPAPSWAASALFPARTFTLGVTSWGTGSERSFGEGA